jgi:hypothetical protein
MKVLKIVGLGVAMWVSSWFWPEINQILSESVMVKLVLGLGLVSLIYILSQLWNHHPHHSGPKQYGYLNGTGASHSTQISRR